MSDIPLKTRWAFNVLRNNKCRFQVASCWLLLLSHTTMHGSVNIKSDVLQVHYVFCWAIYNPVLKLRLTLLLCPRSTFWKNLAHHLEYCQCTVLSCANSVWNIIQYLYQVQRELVHHCTVLVLWQHTCTCCKLKRPLMCVTVWRLCMTAGGVIG